MQPDHALCAQQASPLGRPRREGNEREDPTRKVDDTAFEAYLNQYMGSIPPSAQKKAHDFAHGIATGCCLEIVNAWSHGDTARALAVDIDQRNLAEAQSMAHAALNTYRGDIARVHSESLPGSSTMGGAIATSQQLRSGKEFDRPAQITCD